MRAELIVALDCDTFAEAKRLVDCLRPQVKWFKVGSQLFTACGPEVIRYCRRRRGEVFLDLKFHDIPNTVAQASRLATRLGVAIFTVHAAAGKAAMVQAVAASRDEAMRTRRQPPLVVAVTVLTSLDHDDLETLGIHRGMRRQVLALAMLAQQAGVDGVVTSPQEIAPIRQACGRRLIIVTAGVRPAGSGQDDQKRVMTPREAAKAGAHYLVIGRPITEAPEPLEIAEEILREIKGWRTK